jgi:trehalose-phosphatase
MTHTLTPTSGVELAREVAHAAGRGGAARVLLLDVDGTLAPIAPTPEDAVVPTATLTSIGCLVSDGWKVVLASGRPVAEIRSMVPVAGVVAFGSHGLEGGFDGSDQGRIPVPEVILVKLDELESEAIGLAEGFPGVRVERKPAGLAFHDRLLSDEHLQAWRQELTGWLDGKQLEEFARLGGKRVLELRPQGCDKGRVVRVVVERLGLSAEDRSFVAVGDDVTDEDMFREIRGIGLAVLVGDEDRATSATRRIRSSEATGEFLAALARGTESRP